jgi:Mg2+ and Co2+ transporter CorA
MAGECTRYRIASPIPVGPAAARIDGTICRERAIDCLLFIDGDIRPLPFDDISEHVGLTDRFIWVELNTPDASRVASLGAELGLHALALEDAISTHQRSKLEEYDTHLFIATRTAQLWETRMELGETHLFVGKNYVVTIRHDSGAGYQRVVDRLKRHPSGLTAGPPYALYLVLDLIVDQFHPVVDAMQDRFHALESQLMHGERTGRHLLQRLYEMKRDLIALRDAVEPMQDIAQDLIRLHPELCSKELRPYYRDIHDHAIRVSGTIDRLWKLTGGRVHATDPTNASRTMLYDIDRRRWDGELLRLFGVPASVLPEVRGSTAEFGRTDRAVFGAETPIAGIAGDQQAALFGQGCFARGSVQNTYGTGCFLVANMGARRADSKRGLVTTLACGPRGEAVYALEGSVFIAGAAVQWLRDALGIIREAGETEALARSIESTGGVYFVPAFVGLGAPYWDMAARGAIVGLTRGAGRAEIARAALESIAYQTRDLVEAMRADAELRIGELRVDGGATVNDFLMQFQADVLGARSCGRGTWSRRRWARRSWRGSARASGASRRCRRSIGSSRRGWWRASGRRCTRAGGRW